MKPPALQDIHIAGVYQGKPLFIQNTYQSDSQRFCITKIKVNQKEVSVNLKKSAIVLDFKGLDLFTPVLIEVTCELGCQPVLINPDAIRYHSTFTFKRAIFADSVLYWEVVGESVGMNYAIEQFDYGIWHTLDTITAQGNFETSNYQYFAPIEEGPNKYRIQALFPEEGHLYSAEIDFHFYPEPVTFRPETTTKLLKASRFATYEIFDKGGKMVLSGEGIEIDVSVLRAGEYVIYFDGKDPGVFYKK